MAAGSAAHDARERRDGLLHRALPRMPGIEPQAVPEASRRGEDRAGRHADAALERLAVDRERIAAGRQLDPQEVAAFGTRHARAGGKEAAYGARHLALLRSQP